jgi:hypothetical protein
VGFFEFLIVSAFGGNGVGVGVGYWDFWLRKRKIVPLAGSANAWPTEFPGNGGHGLTICVSTEKLNGGQSNHMHFKI